MFSSPGDVVRRGCIKVGWGWGVGTTTFLFLQKRRRFTSFQANSTSWTLFSFYKWPQNIFQSKFRRNIPNSLCLWNSNISNPAMWKCENVFFSMQQPLPFLLLLFTVWGLLVQSLYCPNTNTHHEFLEVHSQIMRIQNAYIQLISLSATGVIDMQWKIYRKTLTAWFRWV